MWDQELALPDKAEPLTTPEMKPSTSAADLSLTTYKSLLQDLQNSSVSEENRKNENPIRSLHFVVILKGRIKAKNL